MSMQCPIAGMYIFYLTSSLLLNIKPLSPIFQINVVKNITHVSFHTTLSFYKMNSQLGNQWGTGHLCFRVFNTIYKVCANLHIS